MPVFLCVLMQLKLFPTKIWMQLVVSFLLGIKLHRGGAGEEHFGQLRTGVHVSLVPNFTDPVALNTAVKILFSCAFSQVLQ